MKPQKTILRYAGGKSKALAKISPLVEPYEKIVSPFIGGGSLEVHWASAGKTVVGYDIFATLVNFWNVLLQKPDELARELERIEPTASAYKIVKEVLMCTSEVQDMLNNWKSDHYRREVITLPDVKAAAYYYFNHICSYGPGFLGWPSKIYMKQDKWDKTIGRVKSFSCPNLTVKHSDFEAVIENNSTDFLESLDCAPSFLSSLIF